MAKKTKRKEQKPHREPTRRQLARWQYQKKRQRIIITAGAIVLAAVIVISLAGWYLGEYRPMNQTAIKVNNTEFSMRYYVNTLKLVGSGRSGDALRTTAYMTIDNIEQNELIRQGAAELGVTVSEEEIAEGLEETGLPDNRPARDLMRHRLLLDKLRTGYFEEQVPQNAPQRHVMAMLLESKEQALEVRQRIEEGEEFSALAGELSLDYLSRSQEGDYGWHPESIYHNLFSTNSTANYIWSAEVCKLSKPVYDEEITKAVGYWLIKVEERDMENGEAEVLAILLGSEKEALEAKSRIDAGEDFGEVAAELSEMPGADEDKGDQGTITKGQYPDAFDEYVFGEDTETGVVSEPIRDDTISTQGGYWLIHVLEEDPNRLIAEEDRETLKNEAIGDWVQSLWDDPQNQVDHSYLTDERIAWAIEKVR